jgi:hypothetical protein
MNCGHSIFQQFRFLRNDLNAYLMCTLSYDILSFYVAVYVLQKNGKSCFNSVFSDIMINAVFITFKGFVSDTF